jgi:hypothetical protein
MAQKKSTFGGGRIKARKSATGLKPIGELTLGALRQSLGNMSGGRNLTKK